MAAEPPVREPDPIDGMAEGDMVPVYVKPRREFIWQGAAYRYPYRVKVPTEWLNDDRRERVLHKFEPLGMEHAVEETPPEQGGGGDGGDQGGGGGGETSGGGGDIDVEVEVGVEVGVGLP